MKNSQVGLFLILCVTIGLFSYTPIKHASGLSFTYQPYWFFISEPQTIDYEEMVFMVTNTEEYPINVICEFSPIENLNVSVGFAWENKTLSVGETKSNHYWFVVGENFNITVNVRITIHKERADIPNPQLTVGGALINQISYYSEEEGSRMTVDIVDQSQKPISNISVNMFHRVNKTVPWTPIKKTNDSFTGYYPHGYYLILANDLGSGQTGETKFEFREEKRISVEIELVGFGVFYYIPHIRNETIFLQVNSTINNFVGTLEEVTIYAELKKEGEWIDETNREYRQELAKVTSLSQSFWFPPQQLHSGTSNYSITGKIYSLGILIAEKTIDFKIQYFNNPNPEYSEEQKIFGWIISLGGGTLIAVYYIKNRRDINKLKKQAIGNANEKN